MHAGSLVRHWSSEQPWLQLRRFAQFLASQEPPPRDLEELTPATVRRWRAWLPAGTGGYYAFGLVSGLLLGQSGPRGPHDTEKRWDDARRLLHDGTLAIQDRVAGLLLLLYAQRIAAITRLTAGDVRDDGTTVAITLGKAPIVLPPPLDSLVRALVAARRGHAVIGRPAATPWLFAGGRPGQPITDDQLSTRLKNIGLSPLQDRSTALFALAAELPAAILARMLGIHIAVAVQWQRASSGDWAGYAADVSRRASQQPVPSRHETPGRP